MKSLNALLKIILLILLLSLPQAKTQDVTKVGVEKGDWFVHKLLQGTESWIGFLEKGEVEAGDEIKTKVTGFDVGNVTIETKHKGSTDSHSMDLGKRTDSYILYNLLLVFSFMFI